MLEASPITEYRLTDHARLEKEHRQTTEAEIAQVLSAPEQSEIVRPVRMVYQSRIEFGEPDQTYLLRVFVDVDRRPAEVVRLIELARLRSTGDRTHESDI